MQLLNPFLDKIWKLLIYSHALIAIQHGCRLSITQGLCPCLVCRLQSSERPSTSLYVNHNILFTKLKNFNIVLSHCRLKWFASYLSHRCQRVRGNRTFRPFVNSPPGRFAPWTFRPLDDLPPRRFAPWTFRSRVMDGSPPWLAIIKRSLCSAFSC